MPTIRIIALAALLIAVLAPGPSALAAPVVHAGERELVTLTEADIQNAIAAMRELRARGIADDSASTGATEVLAQHGFSWQRFANVGYSIGIALAALRKDPDELAKSMQGQAAMMKEMQANMPPELQDRMRQALRALEQMRDQPRGNLELVQRYREEIEAVLER